MFALIAILSLFAAQTGPIPTQPPRDHNLLGNGGFESWSLGSSFQGPRGPDVWYAMGDTSDAFTQGDIAFTRVEGCPPTGNASVLAQIRANLPQNFVSQRLENFGEFAGKYVTFSISARPLFPLANARIEIDDGISSSSALITVTMGQWGRVTVQHQVSTCPTRLEFRIYPEQTIEVDEAMGVLGQYHNARYVPSSWEEPSLRDVPLGTVLDWYRFDAGVPVPEGFAIADGSAVTDPESPFFGLGTPNLTDRFVRGVTNPAAIGSSGGAASINLSHTHTINHTHTEDFGPDYQFGPPSPDPVINVNSFVGSSGSSLGTESILPPYIGLLKMVRVK